MNEHIVNTKKGAWTYNNSCTFTNRFYADGSPRKWWSCYLFCLAHPEGVTKKEILDAVWPTRHCYKYFDNQIAKYVVKKYHSSDRGWCSNLFAQMASHDVIFYDPATRKWYTHGTYGDFGVQPDVVKVKKPVVNNDKPRLVPKVTTEEFVEAVNAGLYVKETSNPTPTPINISIKETPTCKCNKITNEDLLGLIGYINLLKNPSLNINAIEYIAGIVGDNLNKSFTVLDMYNAFVAGRNSN